MMDNMLLIFSISRKNSLNSVMESSRWMILRSGEGVWGERTSLSWMKQSEWLLMRECWVVTGLGGSTCEAPLEIDHLVVVGDEPVVGLWGGGVFEGGSFVIE
jgi:hypothetical protein